jgi:hypothetical protein
MRAGALVGLLALAAPGCEHDRSCRAETLLLGVTLDASAGEADSLVVRVTVAGGATVTNPPLAHVPGALGGTVEVDFPNGYEPGAMVDVSIDALAGGALIATRSAQTTLVPGCSLAELDFTTDGGACVPLTCPPAACGPLDDGCGGSLACPPC